MQIIYWIILGGSAGWIAGMIMDSPRGIIVNIILGVLGASIGGFLMDQFGEKGITGFNFYSLFVAVLGAIVLIGIGKIIS